MTCFGEVVFAENQAPDPSGAFGLICEQGYSLDFLNRSGSSIAPQTNAASEVYYPGVEKLRLTCEDSGNARTILLTTSASYEDAEPDNSYYIGQTKASAVLLYPRPLESGKTYHLYVNGKPAAAFSYRLLVTKPDAPVGIKSQNSTGKSASDGRIYNIPQGCEYRAAGSGTWTVCGTELTGLKTGTYEIRIAAASGAEASDIVKVTVDYDCLKIDSAKIGSIPADEVEMDIDPIDVSPAVLNGTGPYVFQLKDGPSWLLVSEEGIVTGTRPEDEENACTAVILVQDADGQSAEISLSIGAVLPSPYDPLIRSAKKMVKNAVTEIPPAYEEFSDKLVYLSPNKGKDVYKDFKWTTAKSVASLQKAIDTAIPKMVDTRLSEKDQKALQKAINTFAKACKPGSRIDCESYTLNIEKFDVYQIAVGKSFTIKAVTIPAKTTELYTYTSSDESVFTVTAKGKLTAAKVPGDAVLTVRSTSGKVKTVPVKVVAPTTKITITDLSGLKLKSPALAWNGSEEGRKMTIMANALPLTHTDTLSWSITKGSDLAKLNVLDDNTVEVEALKAGSVTVQVMAGSGKKTTQTIKIGNGAQFITVKTSAAVVQTADHAYAAELQVGKSLTLSASAACYSDKPINKTVLWSIESLTDPNGNEIDRARFEEFVQLTQKGGVKAFKPCTITIKASAAAAAEGCRPAVFTITAK